MIRVVQFLRKPRQGNSYSIERLYEDIRFHIKGKDIEIETCEAMFFSQGFFRRIYDVFRARLYKGDVNHVTGDVHFLTYLLNKNSTVLTIHDCVSLERLKGLKRILFWLFWYWLPEKRCTAIIVVSHATKKQVLQYLNCKESKVEVIYNCVSKEFKPNPKPFNQNKPRLLQIGTSPNKNIKRVAQALHGLKCELVVIGFLSNRQKEALKANNISYENHFNLSREELLKQYYDSDMLVFASTYEGFGLPIIEANAVGRPVVTSNCWSMPEIAGDAACLVNPFEILSIRKGILRIIEDSQYRQKLVKLGFTNVTRFQVESVAKQYEELYRLLYSNSRTNKNRPKNLQKLE